MNIDISRIPVERRRELLDAHPDTKRLQIAGRKVRWYLGACTYGLAEQKGIDLAQVYDTLHTASGQTGQMDALVALFYVGTLAFDELAYSLEETKLLLSGAELNRLTRALLPNLGDVEKHLEKEAAQDAAAQDAAAQDTAGRDVAAVNGNPAAGK